MMRYAILLALLPLFAIAAPVPKSEQGLRDWGEPVDPLKDCKFEGNRGKLTITIPGKARYLRADSIMMDNGQMDAPRVLKEIEGDFDMEVTLEAEWPEGAIPDDKFDVPSFYAGLFIAQDDKNFIRFDKHYYGFEKGKMHCQQMYQNWQNGKLGWADTGFIQLDPKKPVKLRLQRKGDHFIAQASEAGKILDPLAFNNLKFAGKLKIGVAALHTTTSEFKPVFSDLKIEKREAAKP